MSIDDIDLLCQQYLDLIYSLPEMQTTTTTDAVTETQGEILYPSINKLLSLVPLTAEDTFVDLGSATGRIVAQVFLKSNVKEALGIEIIPSLHQQALTASKRIQADLKHFYMGGRKLTFELANFLEKPALLNNATVVFINATCFSQKLLIPLGSILNNIPSIRTVLSLRPLLSLKRLGFKQAVSIECSWDSALCYLYQ